MYDPPERIVECDMHFYSALMGVLQAEERWVELGKGMVLYVLNPQDGDTRKLYFRVKKEPAK